MNVTPIESQPSPQKPLWSIDNGTVVDDNMFVFSNPDDRTPLIELFPKTGHVILVNRFVTHRAPFRFWKRLKATWTVVLCYWHSNA